MLFFDARARIGPRHRKHPESRWKLNELEAELRFCSISGAMVAHTQSSLYEAAIANERLSGELSDQSALFPIWNLVPKFKGSVPGNKEQVRHCKASGVRAVSIYPKTNGWDLHSPEAEELLVLCAEAGLPVYLDVTESSAWSDLKLLFGLHDKLNIILTGTTWGMGHPTISAMLEHERLYLTMERFQIHYGIEYLCGLGLEKRLLFATDAPEMSAGAHRLPIDYAEVSEETRARIASGNLLELLGGLGVVETVENHEEDTIMAQARRGEPLDVPLLDIHMHILDEGVESGGGTTLMPRGGPRDVFHLLERLGCQGGGFMSWNGPVSGDIANGNLCVQHALDASPGGYWGLATVDPSHYSQEGMLAELQKIYSDPRFIGMKPYRFFGYTYDEKPYWKWWEFGQERGLYGLIHLMKMDFSEVDFLAAKYPGINWMVPHCGQSFWFAEKAVERARRFSNVFLEITYTSCCGGIIEYLVEHGGADRVIYGSDLPMRDPRQQLGWVVYSRLDLETKKRVLAANGLSMVQHLLPNLPQSCRPFEAANLS